MTTQRPLITRWALEDADERPHLVSDLRQRGVEPHDNIVDFLLETTRAGAMTAEYLVKTGAQAGRSAGAQGIAYVVDTLWEMFEPTATGAAETLDWLDHSLITLAAFSPRADEIHDGVPRRIGAVAFLDEVEDQPLSGIRRLQGLISTGRRVRELTDYDALKDARRAINPWRGIEALNSYETPIGIAALARLAGRVVDPVTVERLLEGEASFDRAVNAWAESNAQSSSPIGSVSEGHESPKPSADVPSRMARQFALFDERPVLRDKDPRAEIVVWFGTDRQPKKIGGISVDYENRASAPREVKYGRCLVNVPQAHRFGEVRTPLSSRIFRRSSDGRLRFKAVEEFSGAVDFAQSIDAAFHANDSAAERSALIYVHGYRTNFRDAAIRAAQLGYDLNVKGITGFYSWPSAATTRGYQQDADNVAASEPSLAEFLYTLVSMTSISRINFVVHSMGNRLVSETLQAVAPTLAERGVKLGAFVLAAPDINVDRFKQLAAVYPRVAEHTTMYVSERDKALALSRAIWRSPRAGFTPPVTTVSGVNTIEVTDIDVSRLGHGYYAAAHPVLHDIRDILLGRSNPDQRVRLREVRNGTDIYWQLTP